jgi:hypothetical protein
MPKKFSEKKMTEPEYKKRLLHDAKARFANIVYDLHANLVEGYMVSADPKKIIELNNEYDNAFLAYVDFCKKEVGDFPGFAGTKILEAAVERRWVWPEGSDTLQDVTESTETDEATRQALLPPTEKDLGLEGFLGDSGEEDAFDEVLENPLSDAFIRTTFIDPRELANGEGTF